MKPISFLPKTNNKQLLFAIIFISIVFVVFSAFQIYFSITHGKSFNFILGAIFIANIFYLWQLKLWAQKSTKFLIGFAIVLVLIGIFNPFFAMDYEAAHQGQSPNWWFLLATIIPCVVAGMLCFWALDKYKNQFH